MEKVLSPFEKFKRDREKKVVDLWTALEKSGTQRMVAYDIIGKQFDPPLHVCSIGRILKRAGVQINPAKHGRKPSAQLS